MVVPWKTMGALTLLLIGAASAWQFQDWRYGKQLAERARLHTDTLNQLTMAAATAQKSEQDKRLALEQRLAASDKTHSEKMTNAQKDQALLRDRLANPDLRLSVFLDAGSTGGCSVHATAGARGVDLCRFFSKRRHVPVPLLDGLSVHLYQLEYPLPFFAELPVQFLKLIFIEPELLPAGFERRRAAEPVVGVSYIEGIHGGVLLFTVHLYSNRDWQLGAGLAFASVDI